MLRAATFLNNRGLFSRYLNPVLNTHVLVTVQHSKKLRYFKKMSTDCDEPYCSTEPCLMDYGPDVIYDWQENYDKKNKKGNKDLALGILSVIFALLIINENGMVKGYYLPLFSPGSWG